MIGAHMDDHDDSSTGSYAFLAEFYACHAELDEFTTELLMDYDFGEEAELLSQVLLTRHGDLFELRSTHRFDRALDAVQGDAGVVDLYAALSVGPELCAVEVGVEVDLDQDLGAAPAGTRTPHHWKREGVPLGEAFTALRELTRALMDLKDPFTAPPAPRN
ncbi:hypothetical protein ACQEVY_22335 [Streptomyces sp. CA-288835]|uniref:hypothetical protein n=1 Tax=Streptomyces sp. CA-288835 TaxID=3240069 RepID=UPI003D923C3E